MADQPTSPNFNDFTNLKGSNETVNTDPESVLLPEDIGEDWQREAGLLPPQVDIGAMGDSSLFRHGSLDNLLEKMNTASGSGDNSQPTSLLPKSKTSLCLLKKAPIPTSESVSAKHLVLNQPHEMLRKTIELLNGSNWEDITTGLKDLVEIACHYGDLLDNNICTVCTLLANAVRNLRSQVSRAACQTAGAIFTLKPRAVEKEGEDLICALLMRTADMNRFLRADAMRALELMCDNLATNIVLNILSNKAAKHRHSLVRTTAANMLNRLAARLRVEKLYKLPQAQRHIIFETGANLLLEGSLETRNHAKALFSLLAKHPNFESVAKKDIPPRTYLNVKKIIESIPKS